MMYQVLCRQRPKRYACKTQGKCPRRQKGGLRFLPNPWSLEVATSIGILNWDKFVYYPNQQYVSCCGNRLEPIGDWAYLHE